MNVEEKTIQVTTWSDDDMITFSEWYRMWYGHRDVGTNGYSALKKWKQMIAERANKTTEGENV
jgi:hypothetical protein